MSERPPECAKCPHSLQTKLCIYGEAGHEEWVCCKQCPRLMALDPGTPSSDESSNVKEGSSIAKAVNHPPEVRRFLLDKGLLQERGFDELEPQSTETPTLPGLMVALQRELEFALSEERYEDAARIRDCLQQLKESSF